MFISVDCEKAAKSFGLIEVISKEVNREAILLVLFPVLVSLPPLAIHKWLRRTKTEEKGENAVGIAASQFSSSLL
jgi:hypothetical protein